MFCVQEKESQFDKDPLDTESHSELSDDEPAAKRLKINSSLNLQVYQIPANYSQFNTPTSLSIFPSSPVLPKFVNNPLNLANPLALASEANNIVKNLQTRFSLPAKLTITPVQPKSPIVTETGEIIRYKKNGEVAKKRGPPKGYKRKPKTDLSQSLTIGSSLQATALQAQNTILTSLLAANSTCTSLPALPANIPGLPTNIPGLPTNVPGFPTNIPGLPTNVPGFPTNVPNLPAHISALNQAIRALLPLHTPAPPLKLPPGVELVELQLDPSDWFPEEPYKMTYSRKKNPKWKLFPYRCEHCFKGYRVPTTLLQHSSERHGTIPRQLALPCPCCPHVSIARKQHKKHLETHGGRRRRIFCMYCLPPVEPSEPYVKESEKYPFDKCPQYWYASEESLRLHKKRKHPYAAMFNSNWFCTWRDTLPNS